MSRKLPLLLVSRRSQRGIQTSAVYLARAKRQLDPTDPLDVVNQRHLAFDDLPVILHGHLEREAERLHYQRLIQSQLPQLQRYRQHFEPPPADHLIAMRQVMYQDDPQHPLSRKAILIVPVSDQLLPSAPERHMLCLLAGSRYNVVHNVIKIACDRFPSHLMNVKWCSDTLDKLLAESKNANPTFVDLPLDDRSTLARKRRRREFTIERFPSDWLPPTGKRGSLPSLTTEQKLEYKCTSAIKYAFKTLQIGYRDIHPPKDRGSVRMHKDCY